MMIATNLARRLAVAGCTVLALSCAVSFATAEGPVPSFEATYSVAYKGRNLGESVHSLTYDADSDTYRFESVTQAKGLARILRWRPIVEHSEFTVDEAGIKPLRYTFEDGTRKGEDNLAVAFDWDLGHAAVVMPDEEVVVTLESGVLDRAALQVELMRALSAGETPGPYVLVEGDSLKTYRYSVEGTETVTADSDSYETVKLTQTRESSSRVMHVWLAPELDYLPVRIEQHRDGETLTALELQDVDGR